MSSEYSSFFRRPYLFLLTVEIVELEWVANEIVFIVVLTSIIQYHVGDGGLVDPTLGDWISSIRNDTAINDMLNRLITVGHEPVSSIPSSCYPIFGGSIGLISFLLIRRFIRYVIHVRWDRTPRLHLFREQPVLFSPIRQVVLVLMP
jgi:hypothetical protein